jgi:hypothetical protein
MGRVRRHHGLTTPEVLAAALPAELNMLMFCSTVAGLRTEQNRIVEWLDGQVPGRGRDLLGPVLEYTGFDMACWYRRALLAGETRSERHDSFFCDFQDRSVSL